MGGLLKIGFTCGTVELRARELSTATGVPGDFVVEYFHFTDWSCPVFVDGEFPKFSLPVLPVISSQSCSVTSGRSTSDGDAGCTSPRSIRTGPFGPRLST